MVILLKSIIIDNDELEDIENLWLYYINQIL